MNIEKNETIYTVEETEKGWRIRSSVGSVDLTVTCTKADFPTFEDLRAFVLENEAL